ncbi:DUF2182 domain-containing protein [Pelomonas sp. KK5]|uniref:DUF2182 domain-containing protein n=1 Tax=Pelomonas sp. KK5 TaxID=1855730 RepID=UPI00097C328A|nr:DUF2182 domain-containing protein [Pelomonas sp. KK5]
MPHNAVLHRRVFLPLLLALIALAWALLWAWAAGPYAVYLSHGDWRGPLAALCRTAPPWLVSGGLSALAWLLMSAAMMLPTTLPLVDAMARLTAGRADRGRLLALLLGGYLLAWGLFGFVVHGLHGVLLGAGLERLAPGWLLAAATLALAGAFQFSRLKQLCLEKCRTPLSFVMQHWRGGAHPGRQAFALGAHHGVFCIGCCWALMLLMFIVGMGQLGWMLALAAVMAAEKNLPWGRRLSAPLGVALLGGALALVLARP